MGSNPENKRASKVVFGKVPKSPSLIPFPFLAQLQAEMGSALSLFPLFSPHHLFPSLGPTWARPSSPPPSPSLSSPPRAPSALGLSPYGGPTRPASARSASFPSPLSDWWPSSPTLYVKWVPGVSSHSPSSRHEARRRCSPCATPAKGGLMPQFTPYAAQ